MGKRLLVIGLVWPEPASSAAGWRILQLLESFLQAGFSVHFASAASKSPYSYPLADKGIQEQEILLNDSSFDTYVEALSPDYVLFDRFMIEEQYSWRVRAVYPQAVFILDTEDLHFLRQARQEAFKKGIPFSENLLFSAAAKREIASILRCDLSLIISRYEMQLLQQQFHIPESNLCYLPFQIAEQDRAEAYPGFQERQHLVFIGNFLHEPNWRTVLELKRLWPAIRKVLGKIELHVYGAYPSQKVWDLHKPAEGFMIMGRAEDALSCLQQYRILLAPIPFGAGLKGKFVDATRVHTPSISSTVGAEGMTQTVAWPGFIVEGDEDLIQKTAELYHNEGLWQEKSQACRELLQVWKQEDGMNALLTKLDQVQKNLDAHRNLNFLGQILWENQFNSSKYMSLWIQQKNQKPA